MPSMVKRPSHRVEKMSDLVRQEIAQYFVNGSRDPRIGFVTITRVAMSADLQNAKIFYSVYGDAKQKAETAEALDEEMGQIRHHLSAAIKTRHTPKFTFKFDDSIDATIRITELLTGKA